MPEVRNRRPNRPIPFEVLNSDEGQRQEFECGFEPGMPSGSTVTIECKPGTLRYAAVRHGPAGSPITSEEITIPMDLIRELAAEWVRYEKHTRLNHRTARDILTDG